MPRYCVFVIVGLLAALASGQSESVEEFDFIVVGAGTTGGALLEILTREPSFTVLGLDRGPDLVKRHWSDFTGMKTQRDYNYVSPHDPIIISTPQEAANKKQIYVPRFRGVGGTSRIYGMIVRKPSPSVLDEWPNGWHFRDMKEYYKRSESHYCHDDLDDGIPDHECGHHHGSNGPMKVNTLNQKQFKPFSKAFTDVCYDEGAIWGGKTNDYNGVDHNGCGLFQQYKFLDENDEWVRGGSHSGYLTEEVMARSNLDIRTGSPVTRIAFDEDGRAVGVYYLVSPERVRYVAARKEIILSAGSFNTPVLLQVSGVGPQHVLRKIKVPVVAINEEVGNNLWDHVSVPYILEVKNPSNEWSPQNGPFSWMIHANLNLDDSSKSVRSGRSDVQVYFMDSSSMFSEADKLCKGRSDTWSSNEATLRIIDQFPDYRGFVRAQTASIFDRPYVDLGWNEKQDPGKNTIRKFTTMVEEFRKYWQDESTEWSKEVVGELYIGEDMEEWAHRYMESALHPACTCAMGKCADEHLRVKGVQGLRVCDASAFATQVDGNPVATLFAMAEKLGEELTNEYSPSRQKKTEL